MQITLGMIKSTPALQEFLIGKGLAQANQNPYHYQLAASKAIESGSLSIDRLAELIGSPVAGTKNMSLNAPTMNDINNAAGGNSGGAGGNVRVKAASERYSKETRAVVHKSLDGSERPLVALGTPVREPSELACARIGVFAKHYFSSKRGQLHQWGLKAPTLNEHERQLLTEMYNEGHFCGELNAKTWLDRSTIGEAGLSVKALLDDSTSGGQNLVPYEFDEAIIQYPYLHSQMLSYVDLRTCGSSEVRTAKLGQVTVSWGTAEGTEVPLFNTDSLVGEVQIPIHPVAASIVWGKDFEADTPVAEFGAKLVEEFGQANLKELDRVICLGTGTSQPEGFLVASGTVGANSDNGGSGPPTLADYIEMQFAIGLEYRQQDLSTCYISNDRTYQRSRQIKIDAATPSTDQRSVLSPAMDFQSYRSAGYRHAINASISNAKLAFVCLKKYRLYRRAGFDFFITDQGATLARANEKLMVCRGRYGGKLIDPNACAIMADSQS